ncbi:BREX-1 system adenine-specific DNA-methyltransferase PglX, partial [Spirulina sp. 06S082]|uniref:BREX-1 system adenine-specific DNA-methyltransferase PglX n=1 Tax=Spirulina sp. 06S082 TaxID=3110248 RepID=UPI002B216DA2
SDTIKQVFAKNIPIGEFLKIKAGMSTGDNKQFQRIWWEVSISQISFNTFEIIETKDNQIRWYPCSSGGSFRKWFGNNESIVDWENNGMRIKQHKSSAVRNSSFYFKEGITYSKISSGLFSARIVKPGFLFDDTGRTGFTIKETPKEIILSFLCSKVSQNLLKILTPTLSFTTKEILNLPFLLNLKLTPPNLEKAVNSLILLSRQDWDNFETSWDFQKHPLVQLSINNYQLSINNSELLDKPLTIERAFQQWEQQSETAFNQLKHLEEENNKHWIEAYGLQDELTPEVPDDQITIRKADLSRDIRSLLSYAVGCMMGRYSLDRPGLIHAGQPFDPSQHQTFPADSDGIIPITDRPYFPDDIITQLIQFLKTAYTPDTLPQNLEYIANALTRKANETPRDCIRRYFLTQFTSDHIKTYKKRPIYWLFTSGKKRAFNALVYLHRYQEDTLARLRTDYVLELQTKLDSEIQRTQTDLGNATHTASKKQLAKRLKDLQGQQLELRDYQAKLQHLADQRIQLDLDDGVAYNYTRFKGLVYEGSDLKMKDLEKAAKWKIDLD